MLEEVISFLNKVRDLHFMEQGIISIDISDMSIHVDEEFLRDQDNLFLEDRDSDKYPYYVACMKDGVRIYALATEDELREHFPNLKKG